MVKPRYFIVTTALIAALAINLAALVVRAGAQAEQANANRAALVVQMSDGSVVTRCVSFTEPEITGYDLLRRAGLPVIADASNGVSICKIGASGCNFPAQKCFCDCQDLSGTCTYWTYYFQDNGAWKYAMLGAAAQKVSNGAVNGWIYTAGNMSSGGNTPPLMSFDQVCGVTAAQSTATAQLIAATDTSVPASTATPVPATPTALPQATVPPTTLSATSTSAAMALAATATIAPSPTVATVNPTAVASPTSVPSVTTTPPAATITPVPPTPMVLTTTEQGGANIGGYVAFGVIAVGLIAVLFITRRNTGKANS